MTTNAIIETDHAAPVFVPADAQKDHRHRLTLFAKWLDDNGLPWHMPDLAAYRDHLLTEPGRRGKPLSPVSASAHLSSIRARYAAILRDNQTRDYLYNLTPQNAAPADRKAFVDEALQRLANAINPDTAPVTIVTRQDRPDDNGRRLTATQASALLSMPGVDTLAGLRDTAMIALMLCTGIREAELVALDVKDLRQRLGGELALHVRRGKGAKERLIPYGDLSFCLAIVDAWLTAAEITDGAVFRGFYRDNQTVRPGRIHVRAINQILDRYPVMVDGQLTAVQPHDLRRTYARRLYEAGVQVMAIQQNLGHASERTTLQYIGVLDVSQRRPPAIYTFDLSRIRKPML